MFARETSAWDSSSANVLTIMPLVCFSLSAMLWNMAESLDSLPALSKKHGSEEFHGEGVGESWDGQLSVRVVFEVREVVAVVMKHEAEKGGAGGKEDVGGEVGLIGDVHHGSAEHVNHESGESCWLCRQLGDHGLQPLLSPGLVLVSNTKLVDVHEVYHEGVGGLLLRGLVLREDGDRKPIVSADELLGYLHHRNQVAHDREGDEHQLCFRLHFPNFSFLECLPVIRALCFVLVVGYDIEKEDMLLLGKVLDTFNLVGLLHTKTTEWK
ncbi:UDP-glucosyl transferase 71B1 [Actinidia rufa]|uniref:UDP-glucosyl transferase 71B1 n=1 Tax=Actinidia rufa TaxID=165716 RepID=A0A7J0GNF5_9ERIC|nr:UDP-glucosyl transferase 71B1 [Actinidia rufa]